MSPSLVQWYREQQATISLATHSFLKVRRKVVVGKRWHRSCSTWNTAVWEQTNLVVFGFFQSLDQRCQQISMLCFKSDKLLQDQFTLTHYRSSTSTTANAAGRCATGGFHCWLKHGNNCVRNVTQHDRPASWRGSWKTSSQNRISWSPQRSWSS